MNQRVRIGSWITLGHLSIVEIMADAGFDWLCIDLEHSVIDYLKAQELIAAIQGKGLKAYVRVGENNPRILKRVLDAGVDGVIIPMVNSKADAEKAVASIKYPPLGRRGVGLARAQQYGFGFKEYLEKKVHEIDVIVQIEHIDAINQVDQILSVKGINGTLIGPYDLSGSMGKPGQFDDPEVIAALNRYESASRAVNMPTGFHVIQPDHRELLTKIQKGYSFIAFSLDTLFLGTLCREQLAAARSALLTSS